MRIGTDCSGIEAPICALNNLGIKYNHLFSCEIDKYARQSIIANYEPEQLFTDITESRTLPELDVYVAGFPCQPFSTSGNQKGFDDHRGQIYQYCIDAIKQTRPKVFILENVKGLLTINKGLYFKKIIEDLNLLSDYLVRYKVLNTKDYGVPQNRLRIYIVGLRTDCVVSEFKFPEPEPNCPNQDEFISQDNYNVDICTPSNLKKFPVCDNTIFVNLNQVRIDGPNGSNYKLSSRYCGTLTANGNLWCTPRHRKADVIEHLRLQGFPSNFKQVVSDAQMKKQIGNSMSVNVLERLFKCIFKAIEL